jgi:O-antigen/teichoic acid export membrane protein
MLVAGASSGKLVPILFGFYLARQFGGGALAGFVLVLTYGAALTALANLGAAPRIIRAGAYADVSGFISGVTVVSFLLATLALLPSTAYWLLVADAPFLAADVDPSLAQAWVALYSLGLVMYTLAQSTLSMRGEYRAAGGFALALHGVAAVAGIAVGGSGGDTVAVSAYFITYFAGNFIFFVASQRHLGRVWYRTGELISVASLWAGVLGSLSASLFGVITLTGFYFFMQTVQRELPIADAATFAMSFQLFQAGVFLPSLLGNIVVPRMVKAGRDGKDAAYLHRSTRAIYLCIGFVWLLCSLLLARPLLALYGLDAEGATGLVLMQVAAVLAGLQAYFVQRFVALGRFGILALASLVWAITGYAVLMQLQPSLLGSVLALVLAYVACLSFYLVYSREPCV